MNKSSWLQALVAFKSNPPPQKKNNRCGEEPDKTDYFSCALKHEAEPPVSRNNHRKLTRFHKLLGIAVVGLAFPLSSAVHCHVIKSTTISLCMLMWASCQNRLPFFLPARSFFRPIMPCRENISHLFENPWSWDMLRSLYYTAISIFILHLYIYIHIIVHIYIYIRSDPIILKRINLTKKSTCGLKKI